MADLGTLRTAKLAMSEGLLTQEDFDIIKIAFLKAQQIKAGLDAGFIREEDYMQARDAFLHSLDFRVSNAPNSGPQPIAYAAPVEQPRLAIPAPPPAFASVAQVSQRGTSSAAATPRGPSPTPAQQGIGATGSGSLPSSRSWTSGANGAAGPGTVPIPSDLPTIGRSNTAGKKSMAGIGLSDACVNVFNHIKTKSTYKWVMYKVNDQGNEVIIDQAGAPDSSYEQFVAALPENQCRYAVYDYAYSNADTGQTINKLVFVNWAPETAATKGKMMYASTKDFMKGFLDGIGAELQATDYSELAEGEMRDRVHSALTRK